jgi:hypothetical protein
VETKTATYALKKNCLAFDYSEVASNSTFSYAVRKRAFVLKRHCENLSATRKQYCNVISVA